MAERGFLAGDDQILEVDGAIERSVVVVDEEGGDIVVFLGLCNQRFKDNEKKRNDGEVGSVTSVEAVRRLQATIQTIFGYLNSVSGVYPEVASAIDALNVTIEPLVAQIKTRATIAEKKKEEEKKNPDSTK